MDNIGKVDYKQYSAQKFKIKQETEKNINSLFERNVINQAQRDKLIQMYLSGEVSFGDDGLTAEEAKNFTQETFNEIETNVAQKSDEKTKTLYTIQPGDTPQIIAEKLGLQGNEAKEFATKIQAQAIKDGVYYRYGFMAGDMIALPGNFDSQLENMRNEGAYIEDSEGVSSKYVEVRKNQRKNVESGNATPKSEEGVDENAEAPEIKKVNLENAKALKLSADKVADELMQSPTAKNKALDKINKNNVVFVLAQYNKKTSRNLAADILANSKDINVVKNKICYALATRAQELNISGIYFSGYMKINDSAKLIAWIENAQNKIMVEETKINPELKDVFSGKTNYKKRKDINDINADGRKIASELFEEIDRAGSDSKHTKELLKKITPENAAFVVKNYKTAKVKTKTMGISRTKENTSHRDLAKDIVEENGLSINDVKNNICKNLCIQAKELGLVGIYYGDYQKIDDIDKLVKWIDRASEKIINAMEITKQVQDKTRITTQKSGEYTTKTITNKPIYKEAGISKVVEKYDSNNKLVDTTTYFDDGKIVREYQDPKRGRVRELVQAGKAKATTKTTKITEPIDMTISLPNNASENAKKFARALEKNKKALMAKLNLDNDTYNKFARLAMAIAEQETNFGNNGGMYRSEKYDAGKYLPDTPLHDLSYGPTQLKFEFFKRDNWCADKFEKFGLTKGTQLYDMENAAIATIIVLASNNNFLKGEKYQDGIEAARGKIVTNDGWKMENGHLEKRYNTKSYVNKVTDEDVLCYAWNKGTADILDGTMEPEAFDYTREIHKHLEKYTIKEDEAQRNEAIKKSKAKKAAHDFKPMDNNGPIGSIAFMPNMYGYSDLKNQTQVLEVLKTSLANNSKIDQNSKKLLILAVEHGEIGFEFGLTPKEADSLTQKDVDMILQHVSQLKTLINSKDQSINFEDGIDSSETAAMKNKYMQLIKDAELSFKKSYLASKSPTVSASGIPQENILNTPMNNNWTYSSIASRRGFAGNIYDKIADQGVNTNNTSRASAKLAMYAQSTAKSINTSGYCMTGFRQAIRSAGIDDSDLKEGKPRATVGWFERHPDMFEEVKFINIGNGNARQINSTDLPNLPAGYIIVWIPDQNDEKFKNLEGHISITNGNGQAYADETDNLDWGVYHGSKNAGKGEHGTFRVFRLTDKWKIEDGKLKFEG